MEYDLAGRTLALAKASEQWQPNPNGGGACLEVADLDAALAHVKSREVRVVIRLSLAVRAQTYFNFKLSTQRFSAAWLSFQSDSGQVAFAK